VPLAGFTRWAMAIGQLLCTRITNNEALIIVNFFVFLISLSLGGKSAFGQDDLEALREEIAE